MGMQALGMGLGTLIRELGRQAGNRHRPRLPRLFGLDEDRADLRPAGRRLQGARHRPCDDADGLFRAVRARCALRRDGDGLAQRQRLDRREDGRQPAAHLRPGRDDAAEGNRARREVQARGRRLLSISSRISRRATSPISPSGRNSSASSRSSAPAATAPPARSRRRCWRRSAARWCRSIASSTTRSRNTIRIPKTWRCCTPSATRCCEHKADVGARLRRRRRPLRRRRRHRRGDLRRQGRRHAGARHVGAASELDLRGRREVDRALRHRSGAAEERRQGRLLENRPFLHEAPHP